MSIASEAAFLLVWDSPFVSSSAPRGRDGCIEGEPLSRVARQGISARTEVAIQLLAAAQFLFERGFYPERRALRGMRVTRVSDGPRLLPGGPPRRRLEDRGPTRRQQLVSTSGEDLVGRILAPILCSLVPERRDAIAECRASTLPWETIPSLLALLLESLRRPPSPATVRALWARKLQVPRNGVVWVEEEELLERLALAVASSAGGRGPRVHAGRLEEEAVVRIQALAALAGREALVLTSIPVAGAVMLKLADGATVVWALGVPGGCPHLHLASAIENGRRRPRLAAMILNSGAADGFASSPKSPAGIESRDALASPRARAVLAWIRSAPAGLSRDDLAAVAGAVDDPVEELQRLGLAVTCRGSWRCPESEGAPDPVRVAELVRRLPSSSPRRYLALGMSGGDWAPLEKWCEQRLEDGAPAVVLDHATVVPATPQLAFLGAEAALALGRLGAAERALDGVPEGDREACWHTLKAWWAELAGLPEHASSAIERARRGHLGGRILAYADLVAARLAHRRGDLQGEKSCLAAACSRSGPAVDEAELLLAAADGPVGLRALRRRRSERWSGDVRARALHLLGVEAFRRDSLLAGATALRAALRAATGESPLLVGEIYSDLGVVAILQERVETAERYLLLADQCLERAGSRRAVTMVRANRAVLANDRLDWRQAEALVRSSVAPRGNIRDGSYWLSHVELARCQLARGNVGRARRLLSRIECGVADASGTTLFLTEAIAAAHAHLALAEGDVDAAKRAAGSAESSERVPIMAVVAAARGSDVPGDLTERWGLAVTVRLLESWRRGSEDDARKRWEGSCELLPLEAAVGLARFVAISRHLGRPLDGLWESAVRRAETILSKRDLDGWVGILRPTTGVDGVRLLKAVDGVVNAGTAGIDEERLGRVASVFGLDWVEVWIGEDLVSRYGESDGDGAVAVSGNLTLRYDASGGATAEAAFELVARSLSSLLPDGLEIAADRQGVLLGRSAAIVELEQQIQTWAPLPAPVLVLGERGTGKELVARELHRASGRAGRLVAVNCAAVPATLLESELFGAVRGAYSGADRDRPGLVDEAEGGTLFLDEIGDLPLELQAMLLRLVQENEARPVGLPRSHRVDVRFVAATNRDLRAAMREGSFRSDLFDRLAVCVLRVPPLRERPEDVEVLAPHLTAKVGSEYHRPGVRLAAETVTLLRNAPWPGNVRELEIAIRRAVALAAAGEVLGPDRFADLSGVSGQTAPGDTFAKAQRSFRRDYFIRLLEACGGNRSLAARRAGLTRQGLHYQLHQLGLVDAVRGRG